MEGYGLRVMVAEDDDPARLALADELMKAGYTVIMAGDGLAAVREIRKRHFDVIVTDYQMPFLNGLELLALSQEVMPETPVILVSGAHSSLEQLALERGAFAWIRKPAPLSQVVLIVREAVARTRSASGAQSTGAHRSAEPSWQLVASGD